MRSHEALSEVRRPSFGLSASRAGEKMGKQIKRRSAPSTCENKSTIFAGLIDIILENDGNIDDVLAFFAERMLPLDDIQAQSLAEEVLDHPPELGYLTISNALQWRLQYGRVITQAGSVSGIEA